MLKEVRGTDGLSKRGQNIHCLCTTIRIIAHPSVCFLTLFFFHFPLLKIFEKFTHVGTKIQFWAEIG